MQWAYSDYPVLENGIPVLKSGTVEIKMTVPPRLPVIKAGPHAEPTVVPRPLGIPYARWNIASDVSDDLSRFINGKYWHRIDTKLLADFLRSRGMSEAADVYDGFAARRQ
jgi:hypothetical protein